MWHKDVFCACLVCNDVQHGPKALMQGEDSLCSVHVCTVFPLPSMFDCCNAILTDELTRAKEEGVKLQRKLDQTLSEIFSIWPSCILPLIASSAPIVAGSLKWLLLLMLGFVLMYSMCPQTFVTKRKQALCKYHKRPWWATVSADTLYSMSNKSNCPFW